MTKMNAAEEIALRGHLGAVNEALDAPLAHEWESALWAVPRHQFLPDKIWLGDDLAACTRGTAPETWLRAAYADAPVVTQVNDGKDPGEGERWPSCSASAPSIVLRMLDMLNLLPSHRVLEIGTGTGWNAGLLAHRLGGDQVTTMEVDPALSMQAAVNVKNARLDPRVVCGDGSAGYPPGAPYDRIISTCSVRSVPPAWLAQTQPGGVILTPWEHPGSATAC